MVGPVIFDTFEDPDENPPSTRGDDKAPKATPEQRAEIDAIEARFQRREG